MPFDVTKLGAHFRYNDGTCGGPVNAVFQIVPANPYRVALGIQSLTNQMYIRPIQAPSATVGMPLAANAPVQIFTMATAGPIVQQQWNGFSTNGVQGYFFEVLQQPETGG